MLTLRLTDILLMLLTACACAATIYAIALMRRLNVMIVDWRRMVAKVDEILPHIQRLSVTSEEAMRSVKGLADQGHAAMTNVVEVTDQLREVAEEGLARLHGLMNAINTASILVSSFKAGLAAVQACKQDSDEASNSDDGTTEETDDEKRDF